jgi:hypothetical protein
VQNPVKDARAGHRHGRTALRVAVALLLVPLGAACSGGSTTGTPVSEGTPSASARTSATTPPPVSPGATVATEVPGAAQVTAAVRGFYTRYETDPSKRTAEQYLTDAALAAVFAPGGDSDRVYCAQNIPASVSFDPPVMATDQATVVVTTHWGASSDRRIAVTVTLPDMLISKIDCPA